MPHMVLTLLRWGLPVLATVVLLGSIRTQTLYGLPLVVVALAIWLVILPRPVYQKE